ncbi:Tyrosine-protein kinase RYK [Nymphon striatum]|nr:Tyrosine-protein kinase RYK [Nymphon striatum]
MGVYNVKGLPAVVTYIKNNEVNEYATKFNVYVPANISYINFTWYSTDNIPVQYSLATQSYDVEALDHPKFNVSSTGIVPFEVSAGFQVALICSGKKSTEVRVMITLNVTIPSAKNITTLNLERTKICLKETIKKKVDDTKSVIWKLAGKPNEIPSANKTIEDNSVLHLSKILETGVNSSSERSCTNLRGSCVSTHFRLCLRLTTNSAAVGIEDSSGVGSYCSGTSRTIGDEFPFFTLCTLYLNGSYFILLDELMAHEDENVDVEEKENFIEKNVIYIIIGSTVAFTVLLFISMYACYRRSQKASHLSDQVSDVPAAQYMNAQSQTLLHSATPNVASSCGSISIGHSTLRKAPSIMTAASDVRSIPLHQQISMIAIKKERINLTNIVQKGTFGQLFCGTLSVDNRKETIFVKCVTDQANLDQANLLLTEGMLLFGISHPNIQRIKAICIEDRNYPFLIYPYISQGNLKTFLQKCKFSPDGHAYTLVTQNIVDMAIQIAKAMHYLHTKQIIHKDLATRNCVVDDRLLVRITDTALSRDFFPDDYHCLGDSVNRPVKWMALESLSLRHFSPATDVWTFGVTFWELMTLGSPPYLNVDPFEFESFIKSGYRLNQPVNCPDELFNVMSLCWDVNPENLSVTSCFDKINTGWIHGNKKQTQDKNKVLSEKIPGGSSGLFRPIPPNPSIGWNRDKIIKPNPSVFSSIKSVGKPDIQKTWTHDKNTEPIKPGKGPGGFIPRPFPPDPIGKPIQKPIQKPIHKPVTDFSKLFPPSVEKVQKSITQIFIDNKWKGFATKPKPNRRPIYPPVYESPTDIPPNPFKTEAPYYIEPTLKPASYKPQYTEPKPFHIKEITQRPHYTEPTTQRPHYTEPTTRKPHYREPTTKLPIHSGKPIGLPGNPLTGIDTFIPVSNPNLHQIVQSLTLNRFIHVIDEAGLSDYLTGDGPVTLFVPSNEAFERLPLDVLKQMVEDKAFLKKVLEYHIVSGASHYIGNLGDSYLQLTSIAGQKININSHGQVISANGILVLKPDLPASNGVFHIINDVLYPPVSSNIWEILQDEKFSTFVHIIKSSEKVINYFKNGGPYTLFAPSNLAFNKLDSTTLEWIKKNPGRFAETVLSLVTKGMYYSYHLHDGNSLASLSPGNSLDIGVSGSTKTVNGKPIIVSDISAINGVIHVVDELPVDFTLRNLLETLQAQGEVSKFFLDALEKAGLIDEHLTGGGPYTVFVPASASFKELDQATLAWLWENPKKLRSLLLNQFVKGNYYSKDLKDGLTLTSISSETLKVTKGHRFTKVNGNDIILSDVVASNGVIHIVDGVLFDFVLQNLLQTLKTQGQHTVFLKLLNAAGLVDDHLENGGPFTVFAPSDEHLNKVDRSVILWLLKNPTKLRGFLLNHFVSGLYYSKVFTDGYQLTSISKEVLKITKENDVLAVNNKQIYNTDIQATNGVIHVIDGLLFEVSFENLLKTLQSQGDKYKTFLEALANSGLIDDHLTDGGPFTVFVPTEAAFKKIDPATLYWLLWDPENLKALVLKHFVKGVYYSDDLKVGTSFTAVGRGAQLNIGEHGDYKTVNGSPISRFDLFAKNGVIHAIDDVLFSQNLKKPAP